MPLVCLIWLGFATASQAQGTNVAQGGVATASSTWSASFSAAQAVDGNTATGWSSSSTDTNPWLEVDLGKAYPLSQIQVVTRQDVDQPATRQNFAVWASNNANMGLGHVVLGTQGATALPYQATWSATVTDPTAYRYIAFIKTDNGYSFVSELQVFAVPFPATPSGLTATAGNASVSLSWTASAGAASYNVYRATTTSGVYTTISTLGAVTTTSYVDTTAVNGTTYYYLVTAVNARGESGFTNRAQATPVAPMPVGGLFPTGVNAGGSPLVDGAADLHYSITSGPAGVGAGAAQVTLSDRFPLQNPAYWLGDTSASKWVSPQADQNASSEPPGAYVYETTFDLTGFDPASVRVTGRLLVDDQLTDVRLNGISLGITASYNTWTPFSLTSGFRSGSNTLDFLVTNASTSNNPSGLRVELSGTGNAAAAGQVRFYPRIGSPGRMVGGKFQGSNDNVTYTDLYTITTQPADSAWTAVPLPVDPKTYRFLRYLSPANCYGNIAELEFDSGSGAGAVKISGTPFGTPGSWGNYGADFTKVFDGNVNTFFDAPDPGTGDYVGIDQGSTVTSPGQARFYPRVGLPGRMVGGKFQGSNDNVTYTDLYTITTQPADSAWTAVPLPVDPKTYRFLRYLSPANCYGNIAELEFDSGSGASAVKIAGTAFGTAGSWQNQGNDFTKAFDGNTSTSFDAPDPGTGDYVGIDQGSPVPAAPTGLTATAGNASVSLSWTASAGAASYNVKRSTTSGGPYTTVGSATSASFTDQNLTNGTPYYYVVTAVNAAGESANSNQASATPSSAILAAPFLTAQASPSINTGSGYVPGIVLNWTAVTGASQYDLYRSTTPGGEGSLPYNVNVSAAYRNGNGQYVYPTTFSEAAPAGTTYYYQVTEVGPGGSEGPKSNEASATVGAAALAAPQLKGVAGNGQNSLSWNTVPNAVSYNLYRVANGSYPLTLYRQGLTATTFTDMGLTNGTQYSYYVTAVNVSGEGSPSNTVYLTPGSPALAAPLLTAQAGNIYSNGTTVPGIVLNWTAVTGASQYDLYRSTTPGGEGSLPYNVNVSAAYRNGNGQYVYPTTFSEVAPAGTTYYYQVVAIGPGGEGTLSNEASATVGAAALAAPQLKGVAGNGQNSLSWNTVPNAVSYNLYRVANGSYPLTLYRQGLTSAMFTDMGLSNTSYSYYVTAVNVSGEGSPSNTVYLTPGSPALAAPLLTAQAGNIYSNGTTVPGIVLNWTAVTGASQYDLYRSTTPGGEGSLPYNVNVSAAYRNGNGQYVYPTTFSEVAPAGTTYYYQVVAIGPGGEGTLSNEASATVGAAALAAPQLKGVAGNGQNSLSWNTVPNAVSYNLYRVANGSYPLTLYRQGLTATTFTDMGLTNGTQYSYYVTAVNVSGEGSPSNTVYLTPGSPALAAPLLTAQAGNIYSNGTTVPGIVLNWTAVTGAVQYDLYRSTTPGGEGSLPYKVNVSAGYNSGYGYVYPTTFSEVAPAGTTYYYQVVAVGVGGEGTLSNEASATVGVTPLAAPTLKGTADPTRVAISLSWTPVPGAAYYNLYNGGVLYGQGLTSLTFTDTNLLPSGTATYYVTAVNKDGEGTASNSVYPQVNGFFITCPATVTIVHGGTAAVNLVLTPLGTFTGNVLLSGSATPAGTQGLFYPAAPTVNSAVQRGYSITGNLYLNVGAATAPGAYPITITGTANGFTYSTSLTLMVQ